jgi:uncharacterized repeat protein (TIGR01451 family)
MTVRGTSLIAVVVGLGLIPSDAAGDGSGARGAPIPRVLASAAPRVSEPLRELAPVRPAEVSTPLPSGGGGMLGPAVSFEGISNDENAAVGATPAPVSDATGDVGPSHYVQWVNTSLAVYDKLGGRLAGPLPGNRLWNGFGVCGRSNRGDPVVLYDELADRWVLSQFAWDSRSGDRIENAVPPSAQCVAVSQTSDPAGRYMLYAFTMPPGLVGDYSKLGVWPDAYYLSVEEVVPRLGVGEFPRQGRVGVGAVALDRAAMLEGRAAVAVYFRLEERDFGVLPADLDGGVPPPSGTPGLFVTLQDSSGDAPDRLELWRLRANFGAPSLSTLTGPARLTTEPFDSTLCDYRRACIPQAGTDRRLDAQASKLMFRAAFRNFGTHSSLVVNHTVDVDGRDHAGIRWYEIRDAERSARIARQGTVADAGQHRWMGSVALDRRGESAIGYSVSGPNLFPSLRYTGPLEADDSSRPREGTLASGGGAQRGSNRWGDYSTLSVDPADGFTFWYTGAYYAASAEQRWRSRIGSFRLPGCGDPPQISGEPRLGELMEASWPEAAGASSLAAFQWRRCDRSGNSCVDVPEATHAGSRLVDRDVGSTVRVLVSRAGEAGVVSALSQPSAIVTGPPPNLIVRVAVDPNTVRPGGGVTYSTRVSNGGAGPASGVELVHELPAGAQIVSATSSRGGACRTEENRRVTCGLGFAAVGDEAGTQISVRLTRRGDTLATATASAEQADAQPEDNRAAATVRVGGAPVLTRAGRGPLRATPAGIALSAATEIRVGEAAHVTVRVTRLTAQESLPLLAGSRLGPRVLSAQRRLLATDTTGAGRLRVVLRLSRNRLQSNRAYRVVIQARAADGARASLVVPLRARRS